MGIFSDILQEIAVDIAVDTTANIVNNAVNNKDQGDALKILVFTANDKNNVMSRDCKKIIVEVMRTIDETFCLFRDEEKIDQICCELNGVPKSTFFEKILELRMNRRKIMLFFEMELMFILEAQKCGVLKPCHLINLATSKKTFAFSKDELAQCYKNIAEYRNADFDDTAVVMEKLTSDRMVEALAERYPDIID